MSVEVELADGSRRREQFALGGVVPGDKVLQHRASGRLIGRVVAGAPPRSFDPDRPRPVRIISALPRGGALAVDEAGRRGLLTTDQKLLAGQRVPVTQVDVKPRGPVWSALGTPLLS